MKEIWRIIGCYPKYPNYMISDLGRIKNTDTGKIVKPTLDSHGYLTVELYDNDTYKEFDVSMLVAMTFKGHIPDSYNKLFEK